MCVCVCVCVCVLCVCVCVRAVCTHSYGVSQSARLFKTRRVLFNFRYKDKALSLK